MMEKVNLMEDSNFEPTAEELKNIHEAFKKEEFRKMFFEYRKSEYTNF